MKARKHHPPLLALLALACGCSEELGPERMETTRVTGVVTEGGVPVGKGWVEFLPYVGTVGNQRSAPLRPDGTFTVDGVAPGWNRIGIAGAPLKVPRGRRFFEPLSSPVLRKIPRTPGGPLTIEIYEEIMRRSPRASSARPDE